MEADLLELEHVFGFTGRYMSTALYHPTDPNFIVYCIGGLVVLENIHDKNSQYFLRGHDNDISALAISPNGLLIASGQIGSPRQRNNDAPVILWSYRDRRSLTQFSGPLGQVTKVSFSPDGMFLAAISDLGVFMVWDCRDGSTVYSKRTEVPMQTFCWGSVTDSGQGLAGAGKHPSYQLIAYYASSVLIHSFDFDIASMTYRISTAACQLPSSGLNRTYTCSTCDSVGEFTIAGTSSGELCVFNIPNRIFRASLPLSSNGLLVMIELDGSLYVGSGDGKVKRIAGRDTKWNILAEAQLPGRIISMSASPDRREILCGTSLGCIFRLVTSDLTNTIHSESPIGAVKDVAFGFRSDMFLVIDAAGFARVWDSSDYSVVFRAGPANKCEGSACAVGDDGSILTGWKDGFLRCYDPQNSQLRWEIPNAHRGAVTSIFINANYIISGGEDGILRLWARSTHQLLTQYSDNRKQITKVIPDCVQPHIIHSCGMDRSINTYDLKMERRIMRHEIANGAVLDMTQRKDRENELVTCGVACPIYFWDIDQVNPVQQIAFNGQLTSLDMSPSGRYLAGGSDGGEVIVFDMSSLKMIARGIGHSAKVNRLKWSPDEKQLVTVSDDCSIALWNFYS